MAAGAAAAVERGLLRLLQRLDAEASAEAPGSEAADASERRQRRQLVSDLEELSAVWTISAHRVGSSAKSQELVQRLGGHLPKMRSCAQAVRAFVPLQEDVKQRMSTSTAALNSWLVQNLSADVLSESAIHAVKEQLSVLESVPYLHSCYRWVGDTNFRIRFLVSLALVLQRLQDAKEEQDLAVAKRLTQQFFTVESSNSSPSEVLSQWISGRLARYDRSWRQAMRITMAVGFTGELRRKLGRAIEETAQGEWLELPPWPMDHPLASAMTSFLAEYLAPGGRKRREHQLLVECPEHTLQPAALLQILHDLHEPFEVRENDGGASVGAVRLTDQWQGLKALPDKSPPVESPGPAPVAPLKKKKKSKGVKAMKAKVGEVKAAENAAEKAAEQVSMPSTVATVASMASPSAEADGPKSEAIGSPKRSKSPKRSRSKSADSTSLQPKLKASKKKAGAKAETVEKQPEVVDVEERSLDEKGEKAEKVGEKLEKSEKSEKSKMPMYHPYWQQMWAHPMAMPGMMARPPMPMGMVPGYALPKKKKEKKTKEKEKRDRRDDRSSSSSRKKKKEKKKDKKEKKEKTR